ncbi:hypothetical protein M440DRAFT_1208824 [Trichoderma longibrachiatum ATCC 18648]|uniref:Uncharacterized protein n=1 Tax=Trichoderma longibrachiatum ATCC 18648 TaxID=983965 RepID=A0A2T4C6X3_TRILO|nr:hypothetical protein M440DRAFT_1208824 [Trichoderma longibrachiatum ATCC 18648]
MGRWFSLLSQSPPLGDRLDGSPYLSIYLLFVRNHITDQLRLLRLAYPESHFSRHKRCRHPSLQQDPLLVSCPIYQGKPSLTSIPGLLSTLLLLLVSCQPHQLCVCLPTDTIRLFT